MVIIRVREILIFLIKGFNLLIGSASKSNFGHLFIALCEEIQLILKSKQIVVFFPTCQVRVVRFYVSCLLLSSSSCSTATLDAQCSLSDLNHDHPRPVFPAGPQPRPSPPSVPCWTSTTTIHAQCSLPDLNREYPRQVFPAGPHVGRYGTKNVQKKVRKNVRQVCYILLANSRVCGRHAQWPAHVYILFDRLTCTMTCQVKQMIGIVGQKSRDKSFRQKWCQQAVLKCHGGDHSKQSNF